MQGDNGCTFARLFNVKVSAFEGLSIDEIDLSRRAKNCLRRAGLMTIAEVLNKTTYDLQAIRNMGVKSINEIMQKLKDFVSVSRESKACNKTIAFVPELKNGVEAILLGDDYSTDGLTDYQIECLSKLKSASEIIGTEICLEAYLNPEYGDRICDMFVEFADSYIRYTTAKQEIIEKINRLDDFIKERKVIPFIQAYSLKFSEKLLSLKSECDDCTTIRSIPSVYEKLRKSKNFAGLTVAINGFLDWLDFDVRAIASAAFEKIQSICSAKGGRTIDVVTLRTQGKTLGEIASRYGLTRERIRQIEIKAYRAFWCVFGRSQYDLIMLAYALRDGDATIHFEELREVVGNDFASVIWASIKHYQNHRKYYYTNQDCRNYYYSKLFDAIVVRENKDTFWDEFALSSEVDPVFPSLPGVMEALQKKSRPSEIAGRRNLPKKSTHSLKSMSEVTKASDEAYSFSKYPKAVQQKYSDFDREKFTRTLLARFRGGLLFDSIDLDAFRETYKSLFEETIGFADDELTVRLRMCGLFFEGRLFAADGILTPEAQGKLFSYIENSFSSGNKILYYNSIYSDLRQAFEDCFSLTGVPMLKAFIEFTADEGKYCFYDGYMTAEPGVQVDHAEEIANYMLQAGKPVPDEKIFAGLSYIPNDIIRKEIRSNPVYQRNERECCFHMGIFEFSSEDGEKTAALLDKEIEENGYAIWSRVFLKMQEQMPEFFENNPYLSSLGIRNALSQKMSDRYDFANEVISRYGENLSMADVYRLYAGHHAPFSDEELYEFSKEIGTVIYFGAVAKEAVRVSEKLFVPKNRVTFDTAAIAMAVKMYLSSGYIFVKDVDSFLLFPNAGYEWNKYLLESYLLHYSKEFALVNNGTALYNVAGAVVKRGGRYSEFVDICADALAESGVELKEASALDYLVKVNLISRKRYRGLDAAMTKARQIRSRKG